MVCSARQAVRAMVSSPPFLAGGSGSIPLLPPPLPTSRALLPQSDTTGRTKELRWMDSLPQSDNLAAAPGRRSFRDIVLGESTAPAAPASPRPSLVRDGVAGLMADARRPPPHARKTSTSSWPRKSTSPEPQQAQGEIDCCVRYTPLLADARVAPRPPPETTPPSTASPAAQPGGSGRRMDDAPAQEEAFIERWRPRLTGWGPSPTRTGPPPTRPSEHSGR